MTTPNAKEEMMKYILDGNIPKEQLAGSAILEFYKMCDFFENLDNEPRIKELKEKIQTDWEQKDPVLFSTFGDAITAEDVYETAKATIMFRSSYGTLSASLPDDVIEAESRKILSMIRSKEEILQKFSKELEVN
jgi:hypothetical protein